MATELRRSTRTRKQPDSYADEQAEEKRPAPSKPKATKATKATKTTRKKRVKTEVDDEDVTDLPVKGESDADFDFEEEESKPKKKRAKKSKSELTEDAQLYGNPAEGTIIPWGSRTRKQPRIYEVPEARRETRVKKEGGGKKSADDWLNDAGDVAVARELAKIKPLKAGQEETRLRDYEDELPDWYERFFESASKQKMCVLERSRGTEEKCHAHHDDCPCETLKIAGSQGNVYTVYISHLTLCNCPVGIFAGKSKKQCKHVLYVLHHVLKAPEHLAYQAAFLHSELKELFANAPPLPIDTVEEETKDGNRKEVSGECPICFMDFEDGEAVVWCRAACGNNIHRDCFKKWADMRANKVSCPFCRSEWQDEDAPKAQKTTLTKVKDLGGRSRGGYVNVADQIEGY
ncbi:hypothetical protein PRZ48_012474 [Zasmidium cellare]|uniref:Uncharacterized protein n=1 Tax=Zasmidium cellare TaxID=395010 RepID=A0ABR0E4Z6_ZASCE|nr:hypothetical protein PRZ48_012474 [Zasmidium cellare]